METHEQVGKEVRTTIAKIGGTMPENIPPEESIVNVKKRLKKTKSTLILGLKEAHGLTRPEAE